MKTKKNNGEEKRVCVYLVASCIAAGRGSHGGCGQWLAGGGARGVNGGSVRWSVCRSVCICALLTLPRRWGGRDAGWGYSTSSFGVDGSGGWHHRWHHGVNGWQVAILQTLLRARRLLRFSVHVCRESLKPDVSVKWNIVLLKMNHQVKNRSPRTPSWVFSSVIFTSSFVPSGFSSLEFSMTGKLTIFQFNSSNESEVIKIHHKSWNFSFLQENKYFIFKK